MITEEVRGHTFKFEAYGPDGKLKWTEEVKNMVVDEGLDELLDRSYNGKSVTDYVGIAGTGPNFQSTDNMSSHSGWSEVTNYDEATRPELIFGTPSGQSVDNSGNEAVYNVNVNNTVIGGAFITNNNTKGGSSGVLIGGASFNAGDKTLDAGDTLNVTVTATATSQ
jgi:hypothetical protein